VAGRGLEEVIFPFSEEALAIVGLLRDVTIRGAALVIGTNTYNDMNETKIVLSR
jgi:hypothetical protein